MLKTFFITHNLHFSPNIFKDAYFWSICTFVGVIEESKPKIGIDGWRFWRDKEDGQNGGAQGKGEQNGHGKDNESGRDNKNGRSGGGRRSWGDWGRWRDWGPGIGGLKGGRWGRK